MTDAHASTIAASAPSTAARGRRRRDVNTLPLMAPSVIVLLLWMIVPLALTVYFSFRYYNLLNPAAGGWAGFENYQYCLTDPAFWQAIRNTLAIVLGVVSFPAPPKRLANADYRVRTALRYVWHDRPLLLALVAVTTVGIASDPSITLVPSMADALGGDALLAAVTQDWLNELERIQWLLRLSPRLRQMHGD